MKIDEYNKLIKKRIMDLNDSHELFFGRAFWNEDDLDGFLNEFAKSIKEVKK